MAETQDQLSQLVENRYKLAISYYWKASQSNKKPIRLLAALR